jgi:polyisoprenoid-binding protein YceI
MSHHTSPTATESCAGKPRMLTGNRLRVGGPRSVIPLVALVLVLSLEGVSQAKSYKVDGSHTSVTFSVRHLFTSVRGRFDQFDGKIAFDPEAPGKTVISGSIQTASINTNLADRDKHLRSSDFFDVEKYPTMTFKSTGVRDIDLKTRTAKIEGEITIRGVTRPIVLDAAYLGNGKDPWGKERAGFSASTTIDRKDFGLAWNKILETGAVLVGEEVAIQLDVEGIAEE